MSTRLWSCWTCGGTLGSIGRDADRTDVLNLQVGTTIAAVDIPRAHADVRCRCGAVRRWTDGRVNGPRPREAVPMVS